jgi:membrane-associated protease RseP (regulator of RpoE activity)
VENIEQTSKLQNLKRYLIHSFLFILTFFTTTVAGVQWLNKNPLELSNFSAGIPYSALILLMLATHEFGHYFAARHHRVKATLPFFIPFISLFGTLGAVIRIRSSIPSKKVLFDIGSAGPIAGFIVSMTYLIIGFSTLPGKEYLFGIHPEYASMPRIPDLGLTFGSNILFRVMASVFSQPGAFVPPMNEVYHYPLLCVGWFGLLVTAMNLIPIGQLDGGHISYALFGKGYHVVAQTCLAALFVLGLAGFLPLFHIQLSFGWTGWLFWALLLVFFRRVMKLDRPPLEDETPLDPNRVLVGWICIAIFIGSFSFTPFLNYEF